MNTWVRNSGGHQVQRVQVATGLNYTTTFLNTESVLSESGNWDSPIPATFTAPVSTVGGTPGHAVGLLSSGFNDSIAALIGPYKRDQTVTGTVYVAGGFGSAELELHCNMSYSGTTLTTYECDIQPALAAITIAKWNGVKGDVTQLVSSTTWSGTVTDGDLFEFSAIGPTGARVLTAKHLGVTYATFTDTSGFVSGNPGLGLDAGSPSNGANLGWRAWSCVTV